MTVSKVTFKAAAFLFVLVVLLHQAVNSFGNSGRTVRVYHERLESWCPIPEPLSVIDPVNDLRPCSDFAKHEAIDIQVQRLSAAVRVATESWDDNGDVDVDPRWGVFDEFHRVLRVHFPKVHEAAQLQKPHRYSLVYTLKGITESFKPILFMAHQDVVPAGSVSRWSHPPFDPYYDGRFLWGRGSSDCKNNLIGILSVVESLLEQGWTPHRTLVLAFGFDEETGGVRGAAEISKMLENTWGRYGFAMVLDEGGMGLTTMGDVVYARPGIAEKGYMDVKLVIEVKGGHSSRPPAHSGIGIMAELIVALEGHPFIPILTRKNPLRGYLECQAKFSPREVEPWLFRALIDDEDGVSIGRWLSEERGPMARFSMQTSQAVDIVRGGDKVNALPEAVTATVSYRIASHNSLEMVKNQIADLLVPLAHKHGLKLRHFGQDHDDEHPATDTANSTTGTLSLFSFNDLSPSPISPTAPTNKVWNLFSATIRQVFEKTTTLAGKTVIPVGDIMQGNTDTIHYWNLTRNIYRFSPAREGTRIGIHTVDERVDMMAHVEGMRLYYDTIINFDKADLESTTSAAAAATQVDLLPAAIHLNLPLQKATNAVSGLFTGLRKASDHTSKKIEVKVQSLLPFLRALSALPIERDTRWNWVHELLRARFEAFPPLV